MRLAILALVYLMCAADQLTTQKPVPASHLSLPREPKPNLGQLKPQLIAYHDCSRKDCYEPEIGRQCDRAVRFLTHRAKTAKPGTRLALILDIDETALSNWEYETKEQFAYFPKEFDEWVKERKAPAIPGVLRLYKEARKLGVAVFFMTGRTEAQRDDTSRNLVAVGFDQWEGLVMRPEGATLSTIAFRSVERQKVIEKGYQIVLSVGDQMSDLLGDHQAEMSIKLPNPFYYLP